MRKVTEKTFKAYARDAVKELNTLELTAELKITALSAEITLLRDTKEVGHISITADGWVYAKDFTRDEVFNIVPEHDTMKDLFSQVYQTVNGLLDNGWFWIETAKQQEAEQVEKTAEEPQPTPEEADREVTYIDFKPEQDYSEEEQKEIAETVAGVGLELLEKELTELEKLEEESDKADDAWDKDPLNAELEAASSKAYEKEWKKYMDAAKTLARLINMDTKTARQMLQRGSKNREKVWNYLKRRKIYESK